MTTDLVSELRHGKLRPGLRAEAADEIERLRLECDRLQGANRLLQQRDDYVTACLV